MIQLINKIKTALHDSPFVRVICRTIKWIRKYQEPAFMFIVWLALVLMLMAFICLMFDATIFNWYIPTSLYDWFGIEGNNAKYETLRFIGFGIGGMLATIGAVAFNRRATAQIDLSKAQTKHNELIEKRHIDDRFQQAAVNLGHGNRRVRITSFHQFYYLAKVTEDDFRKSIFDILCDHLRHITSEGFYEKVEGSAPTDECQALLNILFKPKDTSVFSKFSVNLQKARLEKMNLSNANLSNANLSDANLSRANLSDANLSHADLSGANLSRADLSNADLSHSHLSRTDASNACLIRTNLSNATFSNKSFIRLNRPAADLSDSIFSGANLSGANFMGVQLKDAELQNVHSIENADFYWAKIGDRIISPEDLPTNKGQYFATWTSDEFWAEVEKNEES